jgi:hypothetical protein
LQQQILQRMHAGLPTSSRRLYTAASSPNNFTARRRPSSSPASPSRPASLHTSARTSPARVRDEAAAASSRGASRSPARPHSAIAQQAGMSRAAQSSPQRPTSAPAGPRVPSVSVSTSKSDVPKVALLRIRSVECS